MEESFKELKLLHTPSSSTQQLWPSDSSSSRFRSSSTVDPCHEGERLDLQLSISLRQPMIRNRSLAFEEEKSRMKMMRWQASEQIRLATAEKTYAEHVREMTRREIEIAQSEFAQAKNIWEKARDDIERAERLKEQFITRAGPTGHEITCYSCRHKFRP